MERNFMDISNLSGRIRELLRTLDVLESQTFEDDTSIGSGEVIISRGGIEAAFGSFFAVKEGIWLFAIMFPWQRKFLVFHQRKSIHNLASQCENPSTCFQTIQSHRVEED